jgi:ribosomal protein S18 acetylase RimI-like enzyme
VIGSYEVVYIKGSCQEDGMPFAIRPYHPSDLVALYRVCLLTGDNGNDARQLYRDEELLGHYYAAPYAVLEPDLCFVLLADGTPCGYILGTRDSDTFRAQTEQEWFPPLRVRYPLPPDTDRSRDADMIRLINRGMHHTSEPVGYPAHLHIDVLPIGQGQGWGRKMMQTFLDRLRALHVPGVHLGVGRRNPRAIAFYERMGFQQLSSSEGGILFGMRLE